MAKYNWRDNYGFNETLVKHYWLSVFGQKGLSIGSTSRENPAYSKGSFTNFAQTPGGVFVFSSGVHTFSQNAPDYRIANIVGQGMFDTVFYDCVMDQGASNANGTATFNIYDLTIKEFLVTGNNNCNRVCFDFAANYAAGFTVQGYASWRNCLSRVNVSASTAINCSWVGTTIPVSGYTATLPLYDNCNVSISSQTDVNLSTTSYRAFNNCKFSIGGEIGYTALDGTTPEELRASFVARCVAQGYTVPDITEYGETLQAGRWIFSNNSCVDGLVITGSEIHAYEKVRLIAFGYKTDRDEILSVTTDKTKAGSFSPAYADSALSVTNGAIGLKATTDIAQKLNLAARTNIIWLGGKYQINLIDIIHNLPKEYGVWLDNTLTLADTPTTAIEAGKTYLLRSSDDTIASIVYNSGTYTSALVNNNNVFIGVSGVASFTDTNGNAQVFEVIDNKALHQTIQMRIADAIPTTQITSGALTVGVWYLVEHDTDQSNTTEYVTYGGSKYYVGSSFLVVSGTTIFTPSSANVHLRKCWADNYTYGSDSFYTGKQQPIWFDILPNAPRCLMENNNALEAEMQADANNNYITSGHPDFYDLILGSSGSKLPAYQVKGTYMQLRLVITTQNPM